MLLFIHCLHTTLSYYWLIIAVLCYTSLVVLFVYKDVLVYFATKMYLYLDCPVVPDVKFEFLIFSLYSSGSSKSQET